MQNKLSLSLLLVSLVTIVVAGFFIFERLIPISSLPTPPQTQKNSPTNIVRLVVPDVQIDLPVFPAELKGLKWEYTSRGVSHLSSSPWPGSTGNSVFYGHNWPNIFAPLHNSQVGQTVILKTAGGEELQYTFTDIKVVSPKAIEILDQTFEPQLTIFTCTGFMDSRRLVLTAKPV